MLRSVYPFGRQIREDSFCRYFHIKSLLMLDLDRRSFYGDGEIIILVFSLYLIYMETEGIARFGSRQLYLFLLFPPERENIFPTSSGFIRQLNFISPLILTSSGCDEVMVTGSSCAENCRSCTWKEKGNSFNSLSTLAKSPNLK